MDPVTRIVEQAKSASRRIVLPEGNDRRTWQAARKLVDENIAIPVVLGSPQEIDAGIEEAGVDSARIEVIDPQTSDKRQAYAEEFAKIRAHKGLTLEQAHDAMGDVLFYGAMMVRAVDGCYSTSRVSSSSSVSSESSSASCAGSKNRSRLMRTGTSRAMNSGKRIP